MTAAKRFAASGQSASAGFCSSFGVQSRANRALQLRPVFPAGDFVPCPECMHLKLQRETPNPLLARITWLNLRFT